MESKTTKEEEVDEHGRVTKGPEKFLDGSVYTGQWKGDSWDGYGIYVRKSGYRYEGMWKDDKSHGQAKVIHANGAIYEG